MSNFDLSLQVFEFLKASGTKTVVVCAGARNAPLVMALQKENFKIYSYFEERSAAFFALGLIQSKQEPVAIITTSGTAVAELLPAAIEANYQGLPLILITADRPKNFRGSGAPQTIEQVGLFSQYVEATHDLDVYSENIRIFWSLTKPIHLNICFDEPLLDEPSQQQVQKVQFHRIKNLEAKTLGEIEATNPLIVVGSLDSSQTVAVIEFILKSKTRVFAESTSQLRALKILKPYLLESTDELIAALFRMQKFQSVIRIGGIPTLRFWRDLEKEFNAFPVFHFTKLKYSGLARASSVFAITELEKVKVVKDESGVAEIIQWDQNLQLKKTELIKKFPLSEPAFVSHLSRQMGQQSVYLGNSLPIRHWDQFSHGESQLVYANRGANGIDGQISTYLGWSESLAAYFFLVGDLTALYDLASLGLTAQLAPQVRKIIIINNFGGQIFSRILKNDLFINAHKTQFKHWAAMWGWNYMQVLSEKDFSSMGQESAIIELVPDAAQTKMFYKEWDEACRKAL